MQTLWASLVRRWNGRHPDILCSPMVSFSLCASCLGLRWSPWDSRHTNLYMPRPWKLKKTALGVNLRDTILKGIPDVRTDRRRWARTCFFSGKDPKFGFKLLKKPHVTYCCWSWRNWKMQTLGKTWVKTLRTGTTSCRKCVASQVTSEKKTHNIERSQTPLDETEMEHIVVLRPSDCQENPSHVGDWILADPTWSNW